MNDLERTEVELNAAVWDLTEATRVPDPPRETVIRVALQHYVEKRRAYGVACHALTCGLCRGHHDDQCWERKLIMGELD